MAVKNLTMFVNTKMRDKMLDNWRAETNYGLISGKVDGQGSTPDIVDSKVLSFGTPTATTGGLKITHDGPTDLIVGNNTNVHDFRIVRDNTNINTSAHASANIEGGRYDYGGVFRINKIEITLT